MDKHIKAPILKEVAEQLTSGDYVILPEPFILPGMQLIREWTKR